MKNVSATAPKLTLNKTIVTRFTRATTPGNISTSMVTTSVFGLGRAR